MGMKISILKKTTRNLRIEKLSFSWFDINHDISPFTLIEPKNAEGASGYVTGENRKPDVDRLKRPELLDHKANTERHDNLGNDRNV